MSTPHNSAARGDFAKTVLMPGDPLRAKFIAETFLENARVVNEIRNMLAYTGTYKGKPVSVMAHGMGIPSVGIYSYELFKFYDVENIIRIGSTGGYTKELKLFDTVLATAAYSESTYALYQNGDTSDIQYPSAELNEKLRQAAKDLGIHLHEGVVHSGDVFYAEQRTNAHTDYVVNERHCICAEMESFGLFSNAKVLGKNAACLLSVSDSFVYNEEASPEERQKKFTDMMKIALEAA